MNEKVIAVIKKIIENCDPITDLFKTDDPDEYYFKYDGFCLSLLSAPHRGEHGAYSFYVYPHYDKDTVRLARLFDVCEGKGIVAVAYHDPSFIEAGCGPLLADLYHALESYYNNIDRVFDAILQNKTKS